MIKKRKKKTPLEKRIEDGEADGFEIFCWLLAKAFENGCPIKKEE